MAPSSRNLISVLGYVSPGPSGWASRWQLRLKPQLCCLGWFLFRCGDSEAPGLCRQHLCL